MRGKEGGGVGGFVLMSYPRVCGGGICEDDDVEGDLGENDEVESGEKDDGGCVAAKREEKMVFPLFSLLAYCC